MSTPQAFNLNNVVEHFERALIEEDDVDLPSYNRAFEELSRLFASLGVLFSFVEVDVTEKRTILQSLHSNDSNNYSTVKQMIFYECYEAENGQKLPQQRDKGSRTLLRLHRALDFLMKFVERVHAAEDKSMAEIFRSVYDETLAPHHTWLIRKSVKFASYAVPSREKLLSAIMGDGAGEEANNNTDSHKERFIGAIKGVYERVQIIYEQKDLLCLD